MSDPSNAGDRAKAYRLRKAKQLNEIDRLWLADYEEKAERRAKEKTRSFGASKAARRVRFEMDEQQEAVGTGTAAATAAAAALVAKEEGRRLDALTINALDGYKQLVADQRAFIQEIRRNERVAQLRVAQYEATHVAMLEGVRGHFAARTEAEIALLHEQQQQQSDDPAKDMLMFMIAKKLGIPVDYIPPGVRPGPGPRPPANGAPKRKP